MLGVRFEHEAIGVLNLRLPPTEVSWDYKMNTQTFTTYAGEVVQALGITFNQVIFTGRFGREGVHGKKLITRGGQRILVDQDPSEFTNWNTSEPYGVGLSQMFAYFKSYFAAASQGLPGTKIHYSQAPMHISHSGGTDIAVDIINNKSQIEWWVYPVSFPSFKRSNEDFAPEWRVECEVYEAPFDLSTDMKDEIFKNYRENIGWRPMGKYSDPLGQFLPDDDKKRTKAMIEKAINEADKATDMVIDYWRGIAPAMTPLALEELLLAGASLPNVFNLNKKNRGRKARKEADAKFGGVVGVGGAGGGGSNPGGNGPLGPGYLPGEDDGAYADRNNPPPDDKGANYGSGPAPIKYTGLQMHAGGGADDRYDLSYTRKIGPNRYTDDVHIFDEKGRIV